MLSTFGTALCAILSFTALSPVAAAPAPAPAPQASATASQASAATSSSSNDSPDYWLGQAQFHTQRQVFGNSDASYPLYRNVKDYGATGDGSTDDTNAINAAISYGNRCGVGCNSSTTSPAIVYFPAGTYQVHAPLVMDYYTQMIGDANDLPTIRATANFTGMAVLDADPYGDYGVNWYINQNNFFRQVRNFQIDLRQMNGATGAGIHWQVAQATSLQNIVFQMSTEEGTEQQGIFMDNGSGGFMGDLIFNGGKYGAFLGSQQFTSRNMTFNNCQTAIYMNWNWGWTLTGITVNGAGQGSTGLDMSNSPYNQTVGSVVLADSTFTNVQYGVRTAFNKTGDIPATGGTLILDNVDLSGATSAAVVTYSNATVLPSGKITHWVAGNVYDNSMTSARTQGTNVTAPIKAQSLLQNGNIFGRSKPQYEGVTRTGFLFSITDGGCKGDGSTDDTACVQAFLYKASNHSLIAYFEHGVYKVTSTINVPITNMKIVGECWSTILASGFTDATNPTPVFQVGAKGDSGSVEISDMLFEVLGPNPGAIMISWNLASTQGGSGMWDTHVRMGGSYGSDLQLSDCPTTQTTPDAKCEAGFMMFHAGPTSSNVYLENTWFWTADHDMEDAANLQISVYNGRGMLIQSEGAVWLWGTSAEHSVLYNYQFDGVTALFAGFMQSETPYYQPTPLAPAPFTFNSAYDDPTFTVCSANPGAVPCKDSWGLRVLNSKNVLIYSTGLYSFFNNYTQQCVIEANCQQNMIHIQNSQVSMYAVTTKASVNMIVDDKYPNQSVLGSDNIDVYGDTVAYYNTPS